MPTVTHDETFRRLALVEAKAFEKGWNTSTVAELTAELGIDRSTVYEYWRKVKAYTRRGVTLDVDKWRKQQMVDLDNIKMMAMRTADLPSAVRAIEVQAKIIGTIAPAGTKIDVSINQQNIAATATLSTMSTDQLATDVAQLLERRQQMLPVVEAECEVVKEPGKRAVPSGG